MENNKEQRIKTVLSQKDTDKKMLKIELERNAKRKQKQIDAEHKVAWQSREKEIEGMKKRHAKSLDRALEERSKCFAFCKL